MPVILTKTIDLLYRYRNDTVTQYGANASDDLKDVIGRLSKLRNEIMTDKCFLSITDEDSDSKIWNNEIEKYGDEENSWFKAPWLFAECYMYRRVLEAFLLSKTLKTCDPFRMQKEESLLSVLNPIEATCIELEEFINSDASNELVKKNFHKLFQLSLWGNKCDLSFSAGLQKSESKTPLSVLDELHPYLLKNQTNLVWDLFEKRNEMKGILLDIVLDNAGFELFTDLCLAEFLMVKGLVRKVRFHVKDFPWFVSDTTERDFHWVLSTLAANKNKLISDFGKKWEGRLKSGEWKLVKNGFWTLPFGYNDMKSIDGNLYETLSQADLILFKGDLNYRKLFHDLNWEHVVPFEEALRQFRPSSMCVLRTLKSDIVVGLDEGKADQVAAVDSDWMINGKYAVIQCAMGE